MNLFGYISILFLAFNPRIEKLVSTAKTPEQIILILDSFDRNDHKTVFDYIPDINPLNPDRMKRFSSSFGERFHPIDKVRKAHLGIDISAPKNLAVHSSAKGKVIYVGRSKGYGLIVIIEHSYGFTTKYAHLNYILAKKGQNVEKGDIIGRVGTTGKSTGDHLHYEIIKNKRAIDPYKLITLKN